MSHLKERKEKICLNCNADLYGRYCHACGQENLEPKETVWHLVTHFFNDITHFDGKFFSTVKYLITKPGFLSTEYMIGRRASYLNPIRMYVFTSAFFFVVLFSMTAADKIMKMDERPEKETIEKKGLGIKDWEQQKAILQDRLQNKKDSASRENVPGKIKILDEQIAAAKKIYGDTTTRRFSNKQVALMVLQANMDSLKKAGLPDKYAHAVNRALDSSRKEDENSLFNNFGSDKYPTVEAYDSIQNALPAAEKDGWFGKAVSRKIIKIREEVKKDKLGYYEHFRENFLHSFPKILFFSLPFFALILKLVYIRRKNYYYVSHGIFAIDVYCAVFVLLLMVIILNQLSDTIPWRWVHVILGIVNFAVWVYMFIYLYKAMRRFYKQGRAKTFLKYILVGFLAFIVDVFLLVIFLLISAISV